MSHSPWPSLCSWTNASKVEKQPLLRLPSSGSNATALELGTCDSHSLRLSVCQALTLNHAWPSLLSTEVLRKCEGREFSLGPWLQTLLSCYNCSSLPCWYPSLLLFNQPNHVTKLFPQCLGDCDEKPLSEFSGPLEWIMFCGFPIGFRSLSWIPSCWPWRVEKMVSLHLEFNSFQRKCEAS